jgi:VWFA-related protein
MTRRFAACITLLAAAARGQDDRPVFRVTSELVLLDVQVIHNKTNTVGGNLQAKDFELFEDGVPQKILFFGRDQLPLSVVLLFDLTQSVQGVLRRLAVGAQTALSHMKPADEVSVMVYAASTHLVDGFTRDPARTAAAIARAAAMKSHDAAFFNEAVYQAAAQLETSANPSSRRIILWLTDNLPNFPTNRHLQNDDKGLGGTLPHTEEDAVRELHVSNTVIMPLLLKDRLLSWWYERIPIRDEAEFVREHPDRNDYSPGDAPTYAELTGGFAVGMRGKRVEERLAEIIDRLRARYTIGYRPIEDKPAGTFCPVKVVLAPSAPLRPQEWRLLVRAGYYRR